MLLSLEPLRHPANKQKNHFSKKKFQHIFLLFVKLVFDEGRKSLVSKFYDAIKKEFRFVRHFASNLNTQRNNRTVR